MNDILSLVRLSVLPHLRRFSNADGLGNPSLIHAQKSADEIVGVFRLDVLSLEEIDTVYCRYS